MSYVDLCPLVAVIPVSRMDWHLAVKLCGWIRMLARPSHAIDVVLLMSPKLTEDQQKQLYDPLALSRGIRVHAYNQLGVPDESYFVAPNFVFLHAMTLMEADYPGRPMLWVEADCVPMRARWVQDIYSEYVACGKPFMGDHVLNGEIHHMTGVAVYPPNMRELAPALATSIKTPSHGWDSQAAHQTLPQSSRAKTIQQVWRPRPFTATTWRDIVQPETALFHQCKDGTLIDALAEGLALPSAPQLEVSTYERDKPGYQRPFAIRNVEILIVTFRRDVEFLKYTLAAVKKYARGFTGVTVAVPSADKDIFGWTTGMCKMVYFDEPPGKGMLMHEVMICRADEICPGAEAILHLDADTMPWGEFGPDDYLPNSKPIMVRETYAECGRRNTNRLIWKGVVKAATGIDPVYETMVRHPQVHLREVYKATRLLVQQHTKQYFDDYVLSCKNDFPQGFAEYPTLGAVVHEYFAGHYTMVDYDHGRDRRECGLNHDGFQYIYRRGRDKLAEVWSHGGIQRYEADMRNWLNHQVPAYWVK